VRTRGVVLLAAAFAVTGCTGAPRLALEGVLAQSEAHYDPAIGAYAVTVNGRVVNLEPRTQIGVLAFFGVDHQCDREPELPHSVGVGSMAGGGSANLRTSFEQASPRFQAPKLWYRLTIDGERAAGGCGALPVG
jgi:hypothetical protein